MSLGQVHFDFKFWLANVLQGRVEFIKSFSMIKEIFPYVYGLGTFKLYYVGKCLRTRVPSIQVRNEVGTNLVPKRDGAAFNLLFESNLSKKLPAKDLITLLRHVENRLLALLTRCWLRPSFLFAFPIALVRDRAFSLVPDYSDFSAKFRAYMI